MSSSRLDQYLAQNGYYESRARAASAIKAGKVKVDGQLATKPAKKVTGQVKVDAEKEHPWVSRGGLKLEHALSVFEIDTKERVCLDVGASTGGFTEVLLSRGAGLVYAVDVGRDQLHERLKSNAKIVSMESTDARELEINQFENLPTLIVCDASFISAMKVLKRPMAIVASRADLVTLVKPQFEVGKDNIGRGGLVRDPETAKQALDTVAGWIESQDWRVIATDVSPVKGGDGNTEYLLHASKK